METDKAKPEVYWFPRSSTDSRPGTVIIKWPDNGITVRDFAETQKKRRNVWSVEFSNRVYIEDHTDHSRLCDRLLKNALRRRTHKIL
jgi:hypothetical protein